MRDFFARLVSVHHRYPDSAEQQQARRLLIMNLTWGGIALIGMPFVLLWVFEDGIDMGTLFMPFSLAIAILTHQFIQNGNLRRARWLFVVNLLLVALLANFPDYRLDTPFIAFLTLPLTAAGALLRRPGLLITALILIAALLVGGLSQLSANMKPTPLGDIAESIRVTVLMMIVLITLSTIMLWAFLSSTEEVLEHQQQLTNLIDTTTQISRALVSLTNVDEDLSHTVEQLRDALNLYHVQIFLSDPTSGLAVLRASTGYLGRRLLEEESFQIPNEDSPINNALRRKTPTVITLTDPENQRSGFLPATQSETLIPLHIANLLPFGVLDLHSADRDAFSPNRLHMLEILGNNLAATLYHIQQTRDLRTSYEDRDRLIDQLENNRRELARANRQLVGRTWGSYLQDRQDTVPSFDWHEGTISPLSTESELLQQTLDDGQARLEHHDDTHVLCVPIRLRGQTLGALEFRRSGATGWSSSAQEMAQAIAERLALSLENARLFEQTQMTAQREQLVSQVTSQLQTSGDLQALLTLAASQFQNALGATQTRIRLGLRPTSPSDDQA